MNALTVAIAGSSGLIGTALTERLRSRGVRVLRLVRRASADPDEVTWDPARGELDPAALAGVDAVVNLAGAGVGDRRWNAEYKRLLLSSRVDSTRTLVEAMLAMPTPPRVLVNGSAQGYYGNRGDEVLDEKSSPGTGFLAELTQQWEAATRPAADDDRIRVVLARTGLVMSSKGGAFDRLLTLIKLGAGGPLGDGRQWWSWITLADEVAALEHLIGADDVSGPVNLGAPGVARNVEVIRAIASRYSRPALVPAPAFALRLAVGEFADEILASVRMTPTALKASGFTFAHPHLDSATEWLRGEEG